MDPCRGSARRFLVLVAAGTLVAAAEIPVVDDRTVLSATISVTNPWPETLSPLEVESSCSCLQGSIPPTPIAPGGRGEVRVDLATAGRSGPQEAVISVITDRPGRILTATMAWIVDPLIYLDELPADHDPAAGRPPAPWRQIRRVMVPRTGERRLRIQGRTPGFAVTGARIHGRPWSVALDPVPDRAWVVAIHADMDQVAADGPVETELVITTTDPGRPSLLVPVELARTQPVP